MIPTTPASRRRRAVGYGLLAVLAYLPLLLTDRGQVAADTKQYLYLDPGRLLGRAVSMWDTNIGLGTVTHQTIGYLFPMGPYYWLLDALGVPDWVAQRLWLGTILFAAGAGVLFLARTFDLRGPGAVVASLVFMLSPYSLHYSARISVILLPWAALPWMIALVARGLRRGGWRHAAIFAVVVQVVGGVNATALVFAGLAPVMFVPFAIWVTREVSWRAALATVARFGVLTTAASLWWMSGLWAQGGYGIDILRYTETVRTVATTSIAPEVLRGLGYWFFYGRDKLGPWIEANVDYTQVVGKILVSFTLPALAVLAACVLRWRYRAYFVLLLLVGMAIAVGVYPYDDPSPFGALLKAFADSSQAGLALRSTGRAVPLVVLGLAMLLGAGVNALWGWCRRRELDRVAIAAVGMVAVLAVLNLSALWNGHFYGENLQRGEIPTYWEEATAFVDGRPHDTRVLEVPGSDFASYQWGNTVDPITPGLIDRPYVARELIPYGSAPSADLLIAFDRRLQEGVLDRDSVAPIARLMAAGEVLVRNDLQFERFNTPRPTILWSQFSPEPPPGLTEAGTFGDEIPEGPAFFPFLDEEALAMPLDAPEGPPVAVFAVDDVEPIMRLLPRARPLVLAGDGEGLVDAAAVGLVTDESVVLYSAAFADDPQRLRSEVGEGATLVVTDTNRKRGQRWSGVHDNAGYTERADEEPWVQDPSDNRLPVFPDADTDAQTVAQQRGAIVEATAYGNAVAYTPEDRAARAFDADLRTAWKVGAFGEVVGERIRVRTPEPVTTDRVNLVQVLEGPIDRFITRVTLRFDGGDPITVDLDQGSRVASGQDVVFGERTFRELEIEIEATNYPQLIEYVGVNAVGFAEIRYRDVDADEDVTVEEVFRLPLDLLDTVGEASIDHPLVLVMTRDRVRPVPPREQEELRMARSFELPTDRSFALTGVARISTEAPDDVTDALFGIPGVDEGGVSVEASRSLAGDLRSRARSAVDGDPSTAWRTPFVSALDESLRFRLPEPVTFDHLDLTLVADGRHSVPTVLGVRVDDDEAQLVEVPPIVDGEPGEVTTVRVELDEALTADTFTIELVEMRPVHTIEYYSVSLVEAPVGIAEVAIPGLEPPGAVGTEIDTGCRDDLVRVGDVAVPVRIVGTVADALDLEGLDVVACEGLDVAAGERTLWAEPGRATGIDLDRLVLTSAPGGDPGAVEGTGRVPPAPSAPADASLEVLEDGRTSVRAEVHDAEEPFWFVLGQSHNHGWDLRVDGHDLGGPTLVNGYANGWLVDPGDERFADASTLSLSARWTPQRVVHAALLLSALALVGCLAIVAGTARGARRPLGPASPTLLGLAWGGPLRGSPRWPARTIALAALVPGALAAALVAPWVGLVVAAAAAVVLVWPWLRVPYALVPAALVSVAALYIAAKHARMRYPAFFEWPTFFWQMHDVVWIAVLLVAATAWFEVLWRRRR